MKLNTGSPVELWIVSDPTTDANINNWASIISREIELINRRGRILPKMAINDCKTIMNRSHEHPLHFFYITFKPFNKNYDKDYDGMTEVKKRIQKEEYESVIITREIKATKIHYNALIWSASDLDLKMHSKWTKRYKIFATRVGLISLHRKDLLGYKDECMRVFDYVMKESCERTFVKNLDYYTHSRYEGKVI